jgi:hypothetical protein
MTIRPDRPSLLTTVAFGALVALCAVPAGSAGAADVPAAYAPAASAMSNQNTAMDALAQARMALQHRKKNDAVEQIERAERALLNLQQVHRDPHLDDALKRLQTARTALNTNDAATVDQQLMAASRDLEVAFASTTAPGAGPSPAIGDTVYDSNGQEIGPVLTLLVDPNGQVQTVVISVGDYLGTGEKTVAVPRSDMTGDNGHPILNRNRDQLTQAQNYWGTTGAVGSSMPPR